MFFQIGFPPPVHYSCLLSIHPDFQSQPHHLQGVQHVSYSLCFDENFLLKPTGRTSTFRGIKCKYRFFFLHGVFPWFSVTFWHLKYFLFKFLIFCTQLCNIQFLKGVQEKPKILNLLENMVFQNFQVLCHKTQTWKDSNSSKSLYIAQITTCRFLFDEDGGSFLCKAEHTKMVVAFCKIRVGNSPLKLFSCVVYVRHGKSWLHIGI